MDEYYHKANPFLRQVNGYLGKADKEIRKDVYLMDSKSGDLITEPDSGNLVKMVRVNGIKTAFSDNQPYVKIFIEGLDVLMKLSGPGIKVLLWIIGSVKPKQDRIILVPAQVANKLEYKQTKPVHDGIKDLISNGIIARAYTGVRGTPAYWINPTILYNGNRRSLWDNQFHNK
jgi:hypothetical protein